MNFSEVGEHYDLCFYGKVGNNVFTFLTSAGETLVEDVCEKENRLLPVQCKCTMAPLRR